MKELRIGFPINRGVVIRSPQTMITAKVTQSEDGTEVAGFIGYQEERNLIKDERKQIKKQEIILPMITIYTIVTILFYSVSGVMGIVAGVYFSLITCIQMYFLLSDVIYSLKYKQQAQYLNILKRIEKLAGDNININFENLFSIDYISENNYSQDIRQILLALSISIAMLFIRKDNIIIPMLIEVCIFIIYSVIFLKCKKSIKFLEKIVKALLYRKPTEEQIQLVWFGLNFISKYDDDCFKILQWYYRN